MICAVERSDGRVPEPDTVAEIGCLAQGAKNTSLHTAFMTNHVHSPFRDARSEGDGVTSNSSVRTPIEDTRQ